MAHAILRTKNHEQLIEIKGTTPLTLRAKDGTCYELHPERLQIVTLDRRGLVAHADVFVATHGEAEAIDYDDIGFFPGRTHRRELWARLRSGGRK
jgi:hypothetical protein